jgi:hypothetical protein
LNFNQISVTQILQECCAISAEHEDDSGDISHPALAGGLEQLTPH